MSDQVSVVIDRINNGLAHYYKESGVSYFSDENNMNGMFKYFCDENGFGDDDVTEELEKFGPTDNQLVDFDESGTFPFKKVLTPKDQKIEILRILCTLSKSIHNDDNKDEENTSLQEIDKELLQCRMQKKYKTPMEIIKNMLKMSEADKIKNQQKTKEIYKTQLSTTLGEAVDDLTLIEVLSMSTLNDNYPFLCNLVDSYNRDRMKNIKKITKYTPVEWVQDTPFFQKLKLKHAGYCDKLQAAVQSYMYRISKPLAPGNSYKIKDSLIAIGIQICVATRFIYQLLQQQQKIPPFQFDMILAVNAVTKKENKPQPTFNDDDESESEDEEDSTDDDSEDDSDDDNKNDEDMDIIGNVEERLKFEKLIYEKTFQEIHTHHIIKSNIDELRSLILKTTRSAVNSYHIFQNKTNDKKQNKKEQFEQFPHHRRFCCFIDRRGLLNNLNNKKPDDVIRNDMIWFNPPSNCTEIPHSSVPEWGFEASRVCLIPQKGYNNGKNKEKLKGLGKNEFEKQRLSTITAKSTTHQIITFSFHVDSFDKVKCYMYWAGSVTRFYPQDIVEFLPLMFDPKVFKNGEFATNGIAERLAKETKIHDFQMESFYRACSHIKEGDFPKYSCLIGKN